MEHLKKLFELNQQLAELLADPAANAEAIQQIIPQIQENLQKTQAAGGHVPAVAKMQAEMAQLKASIDKQAETIREMQKLGLRTTGNGRVAPAGLTARKEMLRDGRCFLDNETARRFGAFVIARNLRLAGKADMIPNHIKEIEQDVLKSAAERVKAGMEVGTDSAGGYLIPDEFRPELVRNVEAEGVFWTQARRIPLAGMGTVNIPKRTGGLTAYWVASAAQITESRPTLGILQLTPEKLGALVYVPNEFLRGGLLADLGNWIGVEMVYAFDYALDNAFVNGDGTASYGGITGILQSSNIASQAAADTHTTYATLDGTDWSNFIGALSKAYALGNARFGLSLSMAMTARALKSTTGQPLYERGGDGLPATIDGFPFTVGPRCPAKASVTASVKFGWFGDLNLSHLVGMIRDIEIATSEHAAFTTDQTLTRGILHVDMAEQDADAVVTMKPAAS
ncbi:MAG: Phage capsid family protein [Planctomycetes bacterium ADurb.Bin126]|nr:MAG: Phage capsid family protein [Planctomycetes bacterium ADurb.Bin126]HOD79962.1 phage major capsid protein [Phycisphaerae bacterium]HQL74019.1 phage major capsid protein [Phycisphaerae bacterium]